MFDDLLRSTIKHPEFLPLYLSSHLLFIIFSFSKSSHFLKPIFPESRITCSSTIFQPRNSSLWKIMLVVSFFATLVALELFLRLSFSFLINLLSWFPSHFFWWFPIGLKSCRVRYLKDQSRFILSRKMFCVIRFQLQWRAEIIVWVKANGCWL